MKQLFLPGRPLILDGALGTQLQAAGLAPGERPETWNLTHPDALVDIHKAYLAAGAQVLTANTFGANRLLYPQSSKYSLEDIISSGIAHARAARGDADAFIAMDIGPTGKLLAPLGNLEFEDAADIFREAAALGARAGADLLIIETMTDPLELKAAVLGAKEAAPQLPILACFTLEANGRMLTGGEPGAVAVMLEGLGVSALGINCGTGPENLMRVLPTLLAATSLPVVAMPNAGLPQVREGRTCFDLSAEEFAAQMAQLYAMGAGALGGCCGTTPAHIKAMAQAVQQTKQPPQSRAIKAPMISSAREIVAFGNTPVVIGERINPTGKPTFQKHLREEDWDYLLDEAEAQEQAGADVLDVNVGLPGIDETHAMLEAITCIQQSISLPLQIDSADPAVLEAALRRYTGKALVNSVNGKEASMSAVFPLIQKYGGMAVALLLDENGIPETAQGRLAIAENIYARAEEYGIPRRDILIDALTMAVSAAPGAAAVTLETLAGIRAMGGYTILGISNVSFGLPQRDLVNAAFFTLALQQGLSAAIINPKSPAMMGALRSFRLLQGQDAHCKDYLAFTEHLPAPQTAASPAPAADKNINADTLFGAILLGREASAEKLTVQELTRTAPLALIETEVIPALDEAGKRFAAGHLFLPQLLQCAGAAKAALALLQDEIRRTGGTQQSRGEVVLATVHGDIHDIGKNIVKTMLETYHFAVTDLGKDVPPQVIADAVIARRAPLCALSALMTTTVPAMEATIRLLREQAPWCKVLVGGAVLTQAFASQIGADAYCPDAMAAVNAANSMLNEGHETSNI